MDDEPDVEVLSRFSMATREGVTVGQLRKYVAMLNSYEVDDDVPVKADVTLRGKVKRILVKR